MNRAVYSERTLQVAQITNEKACGRIRRLFLPLPCTSAHPISTCLKGTRSLHLAGGLIESPRQVVRLHVP